MATTLTLATVVGPVETPAGLKPTSGRVQWRLPAPDGEGSTVVGPVVEEALLDAEGQFSKELWCPTEGAGGFSYAVSLTWWDDVTAGLRTVSLGYMTLAYSASPQPLKGLLVPEMPAVVPTDILAAAAAYAAAAAGSASAADADRVAAEQAAALALTGSPYDFLDHADMVARLRYSGATGSQINVYAGERVYMGGKFAYDVLASGAAGVGEIVLPSPSGVRLRVLGTSDVQAFGADGVGDDLPQIKRAATTGRVHLSAPNGGSGAYTLADDYSDPLSGVAVSVDAGVTVNASGAYASMLGGAKFTTAVKLRLTASNNDFYLAPTPSSTFKDAMARPQRGRQRLHRPVNLATEVTPLQISWPSADVFTAAAGTVSGSEYQITTTGTTGVWRGGFVGLGPWEVVTGAIQAPEASKPFGVMVRGTNGYALVYGDTDTGDYVRTTKVAGSAKVDLAVSWARLGQGTMLNCSPRNAVWSVARFDAGRANVLINKQVLIEVGGIGDIFDVGFVSFDNAAAFKIEGLTIQRGAELKFGQPEMDQLYVFGDSMMDPTPGASFRYFRQGLDGFGGTALNGVANYAQAGTFVAQMLTEMTTVGVLAGAAYVVVGGGTNDIQNQTAMASFRATVAAMVAHVVNQGRRIVWVLPWQFYDVPQSGKGLDTLNYEKGKAYRLAIEQIVTGAGGIVVDPNSVLGFPDVRFLTRRPDAPGVRDNIHFDQLSYQLIAEAICNAIVDDYWAMPESVSVTLPASSFLNGASNGTLRLNMSRDGLVVLSGSINVTTVTDFTSVLQLPRWALPVADVTVGGAGVDAPTSVADAAWININTAGNMLIVNTAAGSDLIGFNATYKAAA